MAAIVTVVSVKDLQSFLNDNELTTSTCVIIPEGQPGMTVVVYDEGE